MRLAPLALALLLVSPVAAQSFRPAGGPWTRNHALVGSAPDGRIFARVGPRLGVTRDGGRTWTVVSETVAPTRIAGSVSALYGAFPDGVRLSTNGGATWTPFGLDGQSILDLAVAETVYALTAPAVYRLGDLAEWQPTTRPGAARGARLARLDAADGTVAVAAYEPSCSGYYTQAAFYRSRDAGATWTRSLGTGYPQDVAVAPDGTAYFATITGDVCLSIVTPGGLFEQGPTAAAALLRGGGERGGVAIDAAGRPVSEPDVNEPGISISEIAIAGSTVVFGTRPLYGSCFDPPCEFTPPSGLYTVRDGRLEPVGFVPSRVQALGVFENRPLVPSDGAVYELDVGLRVRLPLGLVRAFVPVSPDILIALAPGQQIPNPPFLGSGGLSYPNALPLGGSAPYALSDLPTASAVAVGPRVVTASNQYGRSGLFVTPQDGYPELKLEANDIGAVGRLGEETLYAGSIDNVWQFGSSSPAPAARLFRSDDAGETWTPDDAGMTARNVYAFDVIGAGPARLDLAGTSGGVFARTPGQPWQADGLADRTVYTLYTAPAGLLAGTDDGLFLRNAAGAWARYGAGLDGRTVYAVLATDDAFGPWLGVGTDAGLFQTRSFGVASETPALPAAARLAVTTVPNPARGLRTVRVDGLSDASASVSVFDLLGRRVADLGAHEARVGGSINVSWDALALPAGVYVVRVRSGSNVATVRAVVTR